MSKNMKKLKAAAKIECPLGFPYSAEQPNTYIASLNMKGLGSRYAIFVIFTRNIVTVRKTM